MKTRLISTLTSWLLAGFAALGATADLYINDDVLTTPPQIDARAFLNRGSMDFSGLTLPFDTQNTLYFTNAGSMTASGFGLGGFRLDHTDGASGARIPATVIYNEQGASISGTPYVLLSATNLLNRGTLATSVDGLLQLNGQNVDVSSGKLDLGSLGDTLPFGDGSQTRTNFTPSAGVSDGYWGTNNISLDVTKFFKYATNGVTITTPAFRVRPGGTVSLTQKAPLVYVNTNSMGDAKAPTNLIVQAVFVANNNTNISVDVSFVDSDEDGNPFKTVVTKFSGYETNIITRQKDLRTLILSDAFASETNLLVAADTNLFLLTNSTTLRTFRPANFNVYRTDQGGGAPANSVISSNIFTQFGSPQFTNAMSYSNTVVGGFYSAYEAIVDSSQVLGGNLPNADYTNYAGRLEINADNLNLSNARIRGAGVAFVRAKNLVSSANVQVDLPLLFYDLGATNGNLVLQQLAGASITRFASGTIEAWSVMWTNGFDLLTTNITVDPTTMATNTDITTTNYTTMFHVLVVSSALDANAGISGVTGLKATATNTVVADTVEVFGDFNLQSESLTVNGSLRLDGGIWSAANTVGLRRLTNNGLMTVVGVPNYGKDRATPYETWVNTGTNQAYSMSIAADTLYSSGTIYTALGPLDITATSAQLDGTASKIQATGDLFLTATDLKMRGATLTSQRGIQLQVANSLADAGADQPNRIQSAFGFTLPTKPSVATLLGTTFEVDVAAGGSADILWPASDLGTGKNGFSNNVAIGSLSLISDVDGFINIAGISGGKAIYVDFLELSSLISGDLASYIQVADDFTIYFADSNVPVEQLDGALNGHLKWVRDFAGPKSGIDVALADGTTVRVNRNLFNSQEIDSDSDGIANAFDPTPFGGVPIQTRILNQTPPVTEISWLGAPLTTYRVEVSSSLSPPVVWELVTTVSNSTTDSAPLTAQDPVKPDQPVRYYRVTYEP